MVKKNDVLKQNLRTREMNYNILYIFIFGQHYFILAHVPREKNRCSRGITVYCEFYYC